MLHELNARMMGDPRDAILTELTSGELPIPEVLGRLAAMHTGSKETLLSLREDNLFVTQSDGSEHHFPHAADVPALLIFFCQQLNGLWEQCTSPEDDLFVAAFGLYGIMAIQPFLDGNRRTAVDFAQFLLMKRWSNATPPMDLPSDAARIVGGILASLLPACESASPEVYYQARQALAAAFEEITMAQLKQTKAYQIIAHWMRDALRPDSMPTLVS